MRVFQNTERGIPLGDELCLRVGDHVIEFSESLLAVSGATFGNRLVCAKPRADHYLKDNQGKPTLYLAGSNYGDYYGNCDALVRVLLHVSLDGVQSVKRAGEESLTYVLKWQSRVEEKSYGGELPRVGRSRYVHALITMTRGAKIEFHDVYRRPRRRTFVQMLRGEAPVVEEFLAVTVFSYDGTTIKQEVLPVRKLGLIVGPARSLEEWVMQAGWFVDGAAFGLMFLLAILSLHGSILWWIYGCAIFAGCGINFSTEPKGAISNWRLVSLGAFVGAFVPYMGYCLTHLPQ